MNDQPSHRKDAKPISKVAHDEKFLFSFVTAAQMFVKEVTSRLQE